MTHYRLCLIGFGNVGQAFTRLLLRKRSALEQEAGLSFSVTGIRTGRHGAAINADGIDLERALALASTGGSLDVLAAQPIPREGEEFIRACPANILFENSPVNHESGQPALSYLLAGLDEGMHAITANKGPVVHGYGELVAAAAAHGRMFRFESAVMDGAPIFSLFRETLPVIELHGFRGILNSCTNLILSRMEQGESFEQAVRYAQSIGIAETDPSADVDGWDAAIKVAALITVLMGVRFSPQQVKREGIRAVTPQMLAEAREQGLRWKLVCSARMEDGVPQGWVRPEMVPAGSPLYSVEGTSSYCQFETDMLPGLGIMENDPGPETTAYGLLADFLSVANGNGGRPGGG